MFKKKFKKILCMVMLVGGLSIEMPASVSNAQSISDGIISIQSVNVSNAGIYLGVSGTSAVISLSINGVNTVSKITADVTLQKYEQSTKKWTKVRTWNKTVKDPLLTYEVTYRLYNHGTYRTKLVATVTKGGVNETITKYSNIKEY